MPRFSGLKRLFTPSVPFFILTSLIEYIIFHLVVLFAKDFNTVYYYMVFAERLFFLTAPIIMAALTVREKKKGTALITRALTLSLPRFIFLIPFLYMLGVTALPFNSVEAIIASLIVSAITVILHTLLVFILSLIMRTVVLRTGGVLYPVSLLSLSSPMTRAIFLTSLGIFAINLIVEIVNTVIFVLGENGIFFISDIIYLAICYAYLALLLIAMHLLSCLAMRLPKGE